MKAILCKKPGPPSELVLEEVESPRPGPGEVVIAVKACAANYPDALMIQGLYQYNAPHPFSPGGDIAGIVKETGPGVTAFSPGDEVFGQVPFGGFAGEVTADAANIHQKPAGVDFNTAASVMMVYCSVWHALIDRAGLKPGETMVVLGASGGIGLTAVELGKIFGARIIAAASSSEKLELCRRYGADEFINYSEEDLKDRIKALTGGQGAEVIFDPVGGEYCEPSLRAIAWEGRYLVVGFTAGIPNPPLNLVLLKGCQITGVFWRRFADLKPEKHAANMEEILKMLSEGRIKPHIGKVYPLEDAPKALEDLLSRRASGKLVVAPCLS